MARIQIEDLPTPENLTPEELEQIFGAGARGAGSQFATDEIQIVDD